MINLYQNIKIYILSFYFNYKYFGFRTALKLPVLINYNVVFNSLGGKIIITCPLKKGLVRIGFQYIGISCVKYEKTILELRGKIIINGEVKIGSGSRISVGKEGELDIGNNFVITSNSSIICFKNIKFGSHCLLSWDILIMDTDFHVVNYVDFKDSFIVDNISIGNNVWIGCKTLILKGTLIGNNSVIAAGSKLSKKYDEDNLLISGNPGKIIRKIKGWQY